MGKRRLTPFGVLVKKRLIDFYLNLFLYGDRSGDKYIQRIVQVLNLTEEEVQEIA